MNKSLQTPSDSTIRTKIRRHFTEEGVAFEDVNIQVERGSVVLDGVVGSRQIRYRLVSLCYCLAGVKEVISHLRLAQ